MCLPGQPPAAHPPPGVSAPPEPSVSAPRAVPASAADAVAMARAGLAWLARMDAAGLTAAEQADCLRALERAESRTPPRGLVLAAFHAQGGCTDDGHGRRDLAGVADPDHPAAARRWRGCAGWRPTPRSRTR